MGIIKDLQNRSSMQKYASRYATNSLTNMSSMCYNYNQGDTTHTPAVEKTASTVLDTVKKFAPYGIYAASKFQDIIPEKVKAKIVTGLQDYVDIVDSAPAQPYKVLEDGTGDMAFTMHRNSTPSVLLRGYTDNKETESNSKLRSNVLKGLVAGTALGIGALAASNSNKKRLEDAQFQNLLDASASTVSQKDLSKTLGAAIANNASVLTGPLAGYYAWKNRKDPQKRNIGLGLTALSAGAYASTKRYLQKTGPMPKAIADTLVALKNMPNSAEVHKKVSDMYRQYLNRSNIADVCTAAAAIPFMYGAENLQKLVNHQKIQEIQGDSGLSEEDKARQIHEIKSQDSILSKYPYLQSMPFAKVLERHSNNPNNN